LAGIGNLGVFASNYNFMLVWRNLSFNAHYLSFNHIRSDTIIMNRIQFFVLTGLSSLLLILVGFHIALVLQVNKGQATIAAAQQAVNQGNVFGNDLQQLALAIGKESVRTGDQGLKDLLARNQITYNPPTTNNPETPATPASNH
jgi:hypothetical protein